MEYSRGMTIWSFPTRIVYGAGLALNLADEATRLAMKRPLVVTDPGVAKAGLLDPVLDSLTSAGLDCAAFDGVDGNPVEANIADGAAAYASHGADGIVGLGGGSPLDAAKLIAVRSVTDRSFEELDDAAGGSEHIPADLPPVIAVPTTSGTGSEVGRAAVVTVASTGRKTVIFAPQMLPQVAILDPELCVSMPARVTAATGFDALTHCVEAYWAKGDHPMADAIALEGIRTVATNLPKVVADGSNIAARGMMMKAAMMGAVAFQKGLGACHSLAHPLSSDCGVHHGLANALCLPAVTAFNESAILERVLHVSLLLGGAAKPGACVEALRGLKQSIGLPARLRDVGVKEDQLAALADKAIDDACHQDNPRTCSRDELLGLYRASY